MLKRERAQKVELCRIIRISDLLKAISHCRKLINELLYNALHDIIASDNSCQNFDKVFDNTLSFKNLVRGGI